MECEKCGHSWIWHHDYDDELECYVGHPCEHYAGCSCETFKEDAEVDNDA